MNLNLLMALTALLIVLAIAAWLAGLRNLTTVRVMQLGLAGQAVLMALSLWNWLLDKTEPQCQQQTLLPRAMRQAVFFGEGFSLDADFPRAVGEKCRAPAAAPTVLDREEAAQPQHAYLRSAPIDASQKGAPHRCSQRNASCIRQLYRGLAFTRLNAELTRRRRAARAAGTQEQRSWALGLSAGLAVFKEPQLRCSFPPVRHPPLRLPTLRRVVSWASSLCLVRLWQSRARRDSVGI